MRVVDLARELELPPSEVLGACQRLGIDAAWAGAEVSSSDVVVLRAELAGSDAPLDLTEPEPAVPAEPEPEPDPVAAEPEPEPESEAEPAPEPAAEPEPAAPAPIPPTAVGSMPEILDEITPEPEPEPAKGPATFGPLRTGGSVDGGAETVAQAAPVRRSARSSRRSRKDHRFDRGVRAGIIAIVLAIVAVVATNHFHSPWPAFFGWLGAFILLIVGIVKSAKAWYRASTHPEKIDGQWLSIVVLGVAVVLLLTLGMGTYVVVRAGNAADAPFAFGERNSVNRLRWGYQRVQLVRHTGWQPPAKDVGSCWQNKGNASTDIVEIRRDDRIEYGQTQSVCGDLHIGEVLEVYSVNEDADAPYPGRTKLEARYLPKCLEALDRVRDKAAKNKVGLPSVSLRIEVPTKTGWNKSDHDLTCLALTNNTPRRLGEKDR